MCYVMCWGLQHFNAVLHNRKPGTHCLPALKQQACPVLPPPLPCDTGGGHVIIDKRGWRGLKEGMHAFLDPIHLHLHSRPVLLRWFWDCSFLFSARCTLYLTFKKRCRMSSVQQISILNCLSRDISWSVTSTVQSATCKPCKVIFKALPTRKRVATGMWQEQINFTIQHHWQ